MNSKLKLGIRLSAIVIVIALTAGLTVLALQQDNTDQSNNGANNILRDSITLSGAQIRYDDIQITPEPARAKTEPKPELPRVQSMTELLRLFNSMGMVRKNSELSQQNGKSMDDVILYENSSQRDGAIRAADAPTATAAPMQDSGEAGAIAGKDFSQTNAQVQGVEEGDIVKTDGKYIYICQGQQISIVDIQNGDMKELSTIAAAPQDYISEMYVSGERLLLVSNRYEEAKQEGKVRAQEDMMIDRWLPGKQYTCFAVYDISNRAAPEKVRQFDVEGNALSTRLIDNNLYFAVNKNIYSVVFDTAKEEEILPICLDSAVAPEARVIPVEKISYFPGSLEASYLLVGAFDITRNEPCDVQSFLGAGSYFYMNTTSMYIVKPDWNQSTPRSDIYRFSIDGINIAYEGEGHVTGTPLNQYSMDEYNGFFRIATNSWETGNFVTVFDGALKQVGQTPPLAPDESIQSARFMGDKGYIVTYRQTDPLFALDLSDPANPMVTGELKIPGFSQYLHLIGDGLLVGFGRHTQETFTRNENGEETAVGAIDMGMKISLFDISDPSNPLEIDKMLLGEGSYSEATDNPRAMMVDAERMQFGFPVQINGWSDRTQKASNENWFGSMVVGVKDRKLSMVAQLPSDGGYFSHRLCFVGDTLYQCSGISVISYDYNSFSKKNTLTLTPVAVANQPMPAPGMIIE